MVNKMIAVSVVRARTVGVRTQANPSHMTVARTAPAVPGPQGQNPAPNPVAMTTASLEGCSIAVQNYLFYPKNRR
jgi:uncharacterized OsmC-like protein